jgi:glycosyltransferase involved in cell wall biosynthesis
LNVFVDHCENQNVFFAATRQIRSGFFMSVPSASPPSSASPLPANKPLRRRILICAGLTSSLVRFRGPLLETLAAKGFEVFAAGPTDEHAVTSQLQQWNVRFIQLPLQRTGMNPFSDLAYYRALKKTIREIQPHYFLGYTIKPVIFGSLAASRAHVPHICSLITGLGYSFIPAGLKQRLAGLISRRLYRIALRRNHLVFFQNPDDLAAFHAQHLVPPSLPTSVLNGSGVDLEYYQPAPVPPETSAIVFLLIARLIGEKGIVEYVEAARQLKAAHPTARFQLLGGFEPHRPGQIGPEQIHQWVAQGAIEYLGEQSDVRHALAACHVYVLPSYREGMPRTVLEAMAIGRPIITTDVPGCRQTVIPSQNGFLVPLKDPAALAEAMEKFILDPALIPPMAQKSLALAREKYDVRLVNREIILELARLEQHPQRPASSATFTP